MPSPARNAASAPEITPASRQLPVSAQPLPPSKHSTSMKSGSTARTTAPRLIRAGAAASRMPPPLPRTVSRKPPRPRWCVIFIRCASDTR